MHFIKIKIKAIPWRNYSWTYSVLEETPHNIAMSVFTFAIVPQFISSAIREVSFNTLVNWRSDPKLVYALDNKNAASRNVSQYVIILTSLT